MGATQSSTAAGNGDAVPIRFVGSLDAQMAQQHAASSLSSDASAPFRASASSPSSSSSTSAPSSSSSSSSPPTFAPQPLGGLQRGDADANGGRVLSTNYEAARREGRAEAEREYARERNVRRQERRLEQAVVELRQMTQTERALARVRALRPNTPSATYLCNAERQATVQCYRDNASTPLRCYDQVQAFVKCASDVGSGGDGGDSSDGEGASIRG